MMQPETICAVALMALALLHLHLNSGGASLTLNDIDSASAHVAHVYVLTPSRDSPEAQRRQRAFRAYLLGVPFSAVHAAARLYPTCETDQRPNKIENTVGHMTILAQIAANTSGSPKSFHLIFEDDMCPTQLIGSGTEMIKNIEKVLSQTSENVLAVNMGACNGRRFIERARSLMLHPRCTLLDGFGPCTHAWALRQEHAQTLLNLVRTNACRAPVDLIISQLDTTHRYQHGFCRGVDAVHEPGAPENRGTLISQCGKSYA